MWDLLDNVEFGWIEAFKVDMAFSQLIGHSQCSFVDVDESLVGLECTFRRTRPELHCCYIPVCPAAPSEPKDAERGMLSLSAHVALHCESSRCQCMQHCLRVVVSACSTALESLSAHAALP
jgi:hypothetical protein